MTDTPVAPIASEFDIAISPSQVETFDLCARKWAYQKIDRIPSPQNAAAALGEAAHKHRENWLINGIPPPDDKAGKLALVGMEHLPPPGKAMVEIPLLLPVTLDADPSVNNGKPVRVKVNGRIDFFMPNTPDGFVWGEAGVPLIGDHKTTSGEQWAKTADDLLAKDSQAAIYAAYALHVVPTAPAVDLHWSYMVKGSSPRQHQVRVRMSRDHAMTRFSSVVSRAKSMLRVIQTPGIVASAVAPTVSACEAFGGCPYREVCPISNQEKVGALMAQGSLNDLLTARLANPVAAPAAPAPTNHNALAGLLGGAPAPAAPSTGPISNPSAMAALFGTPAPAAPAPIPAPAPATPAPVGGALAGLFGALGTPAPAPTAPVVAPSPAQSTLTVNGVLMGTAPATTPVVAPAAPPAPAPASAVNALLFGGGAPVASAPVVLAPAPAPVAPPVVEAVAPAAPATGVVPPDAPASDPTLTLEDVKAMEAGTKKRGRPKKTEAAAAPTTAPAAPLAGDDMLAVLTRIAVALEALVSKGS